MDVLKILEPRYSPLQLKGFHKGRFDETKTKFYAYTLLSVSDEDYEDLYQLFLCNKGYSQFGRKDEARYSIDKGNGCFTSKDVRQLVSEGIFKYVSLTFYGMLYENEWYVLDECSYSDKEDTIQVIEDIESRWESGEPWWEGMTFKPIPEYREELDFDKIYNALSLSKSRISEPGKWEKIDAYLNKLPPDETPWRKVKQFATDREFIGQPWIAAHIKQEAKSKLNRAFEIYINEAVFKPFIQTLKSDNPVEFYKTQTLYGYGYYPLIYPHTKDHVICIVYAKRETGEGRLYYFLYAAATKEIYEWIKPTPQPMDAYYSEVIDEDMNDLSDWGAEFDFSEPSITMEDLVFWSEHVLKQRSGQYVYLKEVVYQNKQPDIYHLF